MSPTQLELPALDLHFGEPFQMDNISLSTASNRASSSISMHTLGSAPSLRSSLRSSTRSSEQSSLRSFKAVRFSETEEQRVIIAEHEAPVDALPQAHLPIDGTLVRKTNNRRPDSAPKRFSIPSVRLPLQDASNKQPKVVVSDASTADFEAWLSKMGTPQTRPALARPSLAPRNDSKDSDRMSVLSRTKSTHSALSLPTEKEKKSRRKSWINLLGKV